MYFFWRNTTSKREADQLLARLRRQTMLCQLCALNGRQRRGLVQPRPLLYLPRSAAPRFLIRPIKATRPNLLRKYNWIGSSVRARLLPRPNRPHHPASSCAMSSSASTGFCFCRIHDVTFSGHRYGTSGNKDNVWHINNGVRFGYTCRAVPGSQHGEDELL